METIGARLREERLRLGLSQPDFAALAGAKKQSQIRYEADDRSPDGKYLAAIAAAGADITYILTGKKLPAAALEIIEQQKSLGVDFDSEAFRTIRLLEEQFGDVLRTARVLEEGTEKAPSETDARRSSPEEGEMFADPSTAPAPVLDQRMMRRLGGIAIEIHKELKIKNLKGDRIADEAARLYNELRGLVQDINDADEVEATLPRAIFLYRRAVQEEYRESEDPDQRRA